jgi:hypothetical protein
VINGEIRPLRRRARSLVQWSLPCSLASLLLLGGCESKVDCDSIETRDAVLQFISNDSNNPLVEYAARNSTEPKEGASNAQSDAAKSANTKPAYLLGQRMVTASTSKDKRTLECSGPLSVTYGDLKATKEVNFTVQRSSDGKVSVSVVPFQF